jgi:hypothetical protein
MLGDHPELTVHHASADGGVAGLAPLLRPVVSSIVTGSFLPTGFTTRRCAVCTIRRLMALKSVIA